MKWKHITPIYRDRDDVLIAAILVVYPNEPEETFMTPEASSQSKIGWIFVHLLVKKLHAKAGICVIRGKRQMLDMGIE